MYGKIFDSIYDGTLRAHWQGLVTFQQLIILADKDGIIDMTPHAIHGRTGIPLEIIESGLDHLSKPDPYSRSSAEEGRRIVLLDEHRPWGWRLVNHAYYNSIRSAAEKREADRTRVYAKRAGEEKHKDGFVYFIGCDDDGPIKIGFSQNPWARLTELQTGSHSKFEVLCAVKGAHADERSFHKEFSTLRIQGEWFKRDTSLIKKIKELSSSQELREECSETQDYVADVAPVAVSVSVTTKTNTSDAARPVHVYSPEFETAWKSYPPRAGSNPKNKAYKAWQARLKQNSTAQAMTDGVIRYLNFCKTTGKLNTEYVMQAATFFGPDNRFAEIWETPKPSPKPNPPRSGSMSESEIMALGRKNNIEARPGESMDQYRVRILRSVDESDRT